MAATITSLGVEDIPITNQTGTGKRVRIYLVSTAASAGSTINFATYVPGITDIEGIVYETDGNAVETTSSTWSGTTLTLSASYSGVPELCVVAKG